MVALEIQEPLEEPSASIFWIVWQPRSAPLTDGREGSARAERAGCLPAFVAERGAVIDIARPATGAKSCLTLFMNPRMWTRGREVGAGTKIWHFSHVMKGARIGERCVIGQNVNVDGGTVIGNNVKIQNNVSVYTGVVIEDDVFLGPSCVSNERHQSPVPGEPALALREDHVEARLLDWGQCDDRLRGDDWALCVCRRRFGGDQGRAGLRVGDGESGEAGGLDEPPRAPA